MDSTTSTPVDRRDTTHSNRIVRVMVNNRRNGADWSIEANFLLRDPSRGECRPKHCVVFQSSSIYLRSSVRSMWMTRRTNSTPLNRSVTWCEDVPKLRSVNAFAFVLDRSLVNAGAVSILWLRRDPWHVFVLDEISVEERSGRFRRVDCSSFNANECRSCSCLVY